MGLTLISPKNSFVQFDVSDVISGCAEITGSQCLPVMEDNDINFQFVIQADTEGEADLLCDLTNSLLTIGITDKCTDGLLLTFGAKTERYRISPTQVLYNWSHGLPNFATVIANDRCFHIKILTSQYGTDYSWCSNCFIRIIDGCFTSVLDYNGDDNQYGFDYCGGQAVGDDTTTCEPTIIVFTGQATLSIPYTAQLQAKYGNVPTVTVWQNDPITGDLVDMGQRVAFDSFPPTVIKIDNGGVASGIVKIS